VRLCSSSRTVDAYGVHSGVSRAAKVLQRVLGLPVTGIVGDGDIAATRKHFTADLIARVCDERLAFLKSLKTWPFIFCRSSFRKGSPGIQRRQGVTLGVVLSARYMRRDRRGAMRMNIRDAVASRFSCRAFLPTPVPQSIVREILELSARAPSGSNLQPWLVHALTGEPLMRLKKQLEPRYGELPRGDGPGYEVFPAKLHEPYRTRRFDVGLQLYESLGIAYEDRDARLRQYARNLVFFDAPVALFFVIERTLHPAQWADLGMFVQTVMLVARGYDLHTCAQQAWVPWSKTVEQFLELPPAQMLFCGMALGQANESAPENAWRSPREPIEKWATFSGF